MVVASGDQVVESFGVEELAHGAEGLLALATGDISAGDIGVLANDCLADVGDGDLIGGQFLRIDPDVDGALDSADDADLADAFGALDLGFDDSVGDFGQLALGAIAGEGEGEDGLRVVVEFGDDGWVGVVGEILDDGGDAITNVLGGDVDVAGERKGGGDPRGALSADRAEFFDAFDGVDGFFDAFDDFGFHLLGGSAAQRGADAHRRQVHGGEAIDAEAEIGSRANDHEGEDDHGGKDRPLD
jgi:hypothetical protein